MSGGSPPKDRPADAKPQKKAKEEPTITEHDRVCEQLSNVPVLCKLTPTQRRKLAEAMQKETFGDGDSVFNEGDPGSSFYIIVSGKARVVKGSVEVIKLLVGDYFGETALLTNDPRGASVIAEGALQLLSLKKQEFEKLFGTDALNVKLVKRTAISAETNGDGASDAPSTDCVDTPLAPGGAYRTKTEEIQSLIMTAVKTIVLFNDLNHDHLEHIVEQMYRQEIKAGVSVIKQGEYGNNIFIVESGVFSVYMEENGAEAKVATKDKGAIFGELALMYNAQRNATVTADEDAVVWMVDRYTFRRIVKDVGVSELEKYILFLNKVELLSGLTANERIKIAEALEEIEYPADTVVFKEGDGGDAMYLVSSGEVVMKKKATDELKEQNPDIAPDAEGQMVVNHSGPMGYFGERALLTKEKRAATVVTIVPTTLLKLDHEAFTLLLGPLSDILNHNLGKYEQPISETLADDSVAMEDISFEKLEVIGTLGKGSFGHVQLVKHKDTGTTYALKGVMKQQIVLTRQQMHIISEKQVMMRLKHPCLVRLYCTYKTQDMLYFLLNPVMGGELFSLLRNRHLFPETTSIFYAGCVVLAFEYMHHKDIVYRDLKPENLLLDDEGYIKVTDFGFAKRIGNAKTWTLCGTPDYLAPEIVSGRGHGKGVDWWTLGVLIYEMLASYTPFFHQDQMKMYEYIVRGKFRFPAHFSVQAKSIVMGLLERKPTKRFGNIQAQVNDKILWGAKLIKDQEWWSRNPDFNWEDLYHRKMEAPIVPDIADPEDMHNFDSYPGEDEGVIPYVDDGSNWDVDF